MKPEKKNGVGALEDTDFVDSFENPIFNTQDDMPLLGEPAKQPDVYMDTHQQIPDFSLFSLSRSRVRALPCLFKQSP